SSPMPPGTCWARPPWPPGAGRCWRTTGPDGPRRLSGACQWGCRALDSRGGRRGGRCRQHTVAPEEAPMARIARKFLIVVILALAMLEEAAAIFERLGARPW